MKKIEAIIRVSAFEAVRDALDRLGIDGMTVTEVVGFGHEPGHSASYRGTTYSVDSHPRLRLEVVAREFEAGPIAHAIATAARRGRVGDGLVTILSVDDAVRIRTAERGQAAVSSPMRPAAGHRLARARAGAGPRAR